MFCDAALFERLPEIYVCALFVEVKLEVVRSTDSHLFYTLLNIDVTSVGYALFSPWDCV